MQISISAEQIDELAKEALVKSAFGKTIQDTVNKLVGASYNNPVEDALRVYVKNVATQVIEQKFKGQVEELVLAAVAKHLTKEVVEGLADKTVTSIVRAIQSDRY